MGFVSLYDEKEWKRKRNRKKKWKFHLMHSIKFLKLWYVPFVHKNLFAQLNDRHKTLLLVFYFIFCSLCFTACWGFQYRRQTKLIWINKMKGSIPYWFEFSSSLPQFPHILLVFCPHSKNEIWFYVACK